MNRLSHSSIRTYEECARKYKLHYKDKLRPTTQKSALFFGSALDKALEHLHKTNSNEEQTEQAFIETLNYQKLNGKTIYLPTSLQVLYNIGDFDIDLLTQEDIEDLSMAAIEYVPNIIEDNIDIEMLFNICSSHKKQSKYKHWNEEENIFFNICCHTSLFRKGLLMLKAHRQEILPKFKQIFGSQVEIALDNGQGDTLIGFIDVIAEWEDGRKVVFDYKTSSKPYEAASVLSSPQLAIYCHASEIPNGGYIVFNKKVKKHAIKICTVCQFDGSATRHNNCPNIIDGSRCSGDYKITKTLGIDIQVLVDTIPAETETAILNKIETVNQNIKDELFEPNYSACIGPFGKCVYFDYCNKGSLEGLESLNVINDNGEYINETH